MNNRYLRQIIATCFGKADAQQIRNTARCRAIYEQVEERQHDICSIARCHNPVASMTPDGDLREHQLIDTAKWSGRCRRDKRHVPGDALRLVLDASGRRSPIVGGNPPKQPMDLEFLHIHARGGS